MTDKLVTAPPSASMLELRDLMLTNLVRRVVIAQDKHGLGIVSQRDIMRFIFNDTKGLPLDKVKAEQIMSKPLIVSKKSDSIQAAAKSMIERSISSVVIVDGKEELAGIVTKSDLCRHFGLSYRGWFKVKEFMTKSVVTVKAHQSIFYAFATFDKHQISRLVVEDGQIAGVITLSDLVVQSPLFGSVRGSQAGARRKLLGPAETMAMMTVGDVMTRNPITVLAESDLAGAASLMNMHGISGLPVLNSAGGLSGIVTKTDVTRAVIRT
jgi:CBS domain-containing protein